MPTILNHSNTNCLVVARGSLFHDRQAEQHMVQKWIV